MMNNFGIKLLIFLQYKIGRFVLKNNEYGLLNNCFTYLHPNMGYSVVNSAESSNKFHGPNSSWQTYEKQVKCFGLLLKTY